MFLKFITKRINFNYLKIHFCKTSFSMIMPLIGRGECLCGFRDSSTPKIDTVFLKGHHALPLARAQFIGYYVLGTVSIISFMTKCQEKKVNPRTGILSALIMPTWPHMSSWFGFSPVPIPGSFPCLQVFTWAVASA